MLGVDAGASPQDGMDVSLLSTPHLPIRALLT